MISTLLEQNTIEHLIYIASTIGEFFLIVFERLLQLVKCIVIGRTNLKLFKMCWIRWIINYISRLSSTFWRSYEIIKNIPYKKHNKKNWRNCHQFKLQITSIRLENNYFFTNIKKSLITMIISITRIFTR
jgi:hypothetical protein